MKIVIPVLGINTYTQRYTNLLIDQGNSVTFICPNEYFLRNSELVERADFIIQESVIRGYPELNLGQGLMNLESGWYLRLDSDEWLPSVRMKTLDNLIPYLNKSCCYGFARDWVWNSNGIFGITRYKRMFWENEFRSSGSVSLHDQNYRLFHRDYIYPKRSLHSSGWFSGSYSSIIEIGSIYHLDWVMNSRAKAKNQANELDDFTLTDFSIFDDVYQHIKTKDSVDLPMRIDTEELEYLLEGIINEKNS